MAESFQIYSVLLNCGVSIDGAPLDAEACCSIIPLGSIWIPARRWSSVCVSCSLAKPPSAQVSEVCLNEQMDVGAAEEFAVDVVQAL